jgi:hypothetical protein
VPVLAGLSPAQIRVAMQLWRQRADALDEGPAPVERPNEVHVGNTIDGRGELHGSFDADLAAVIEAALRVADPKDFELTLPKRRASALGQVCRHSWVTLVGLLGHPRRRASRPGVADGCLQRHRPA